MHLCYVHSATKLIPSTYPQSIEMRTIPRENSAQSCVYIASMHKPLPSTLCFPPQTCKERLYPFVRLAFSWPEVSNRVETESPYLAHFIGEVLSDAFCCALIHDTVARCAHDKFRCQFPTVCQHDLTRLEFQDLSLLRTYAPRWLRSICVRKCRYINQSLCRNTSCNDRFHGCRNRI